MKRIKAWFRDRRRGYTDADWEYAKFLFTHPAKPGEVRYLTRGEYKAYYVFARIYWEC